MRIVMCMPSKNVYVSESDLPLFEQAAALAGSLSTAVAEGLRLYVAKRRRDTGGDEMRTIELAVDEGPVVVTKRFTGAPVLRFERVEAGRARTFRVYRTARGQFAVYQRDDPDWSAMADVGDWDDVRDEHGGPGEQRDEWRGEWWASGPRTLRVYADIAAMADDVPADLVRALEAAADRPAVEELDI